MLRFALLLAVFAGCDRGPKSEAATPSQAVAPVTAPAPGKTFGAAMSVAEVTPISKILATPDAYNGKTVKVEGMITDVCPKRGCWFEMAGEGTGEKMKFKVVDGEMVFPVDSKGMYATAQGQVSVKQLSLEESKQYAEYQAKEYGKPYDPASVTKPTLIVRLDGTGAVLRDKK